MGNFEKAAKLLYAKATGPKLTDTFRISTREEASELSTMQRLSGEIRSAVIKLSAEPSAIQPYAANLRLHALHNIRESFNGRISAVVANIFGDEAHHWMKKTVDEFQEKLDTMLRSRHTEDELSIRLTQFWKTFDSLCYIRLRAHDRSFDDAKYKQLKTCMEINVGTTLGITFADDRTINPTHTALLDRSFNYIHSLSEVRNS